MPMGVPQPEVTMLAAWLRDYIDENNRPQLSGAESVEYERLGEELPTNKMLLSNAELFRIPVWKRWSQQLISEGWRDKVTVHEHLLNINSVSTDVIQIRWGLSKTVAEKLVKIEKKSLSHQ